MNPLLCHIPEPFGADVVSTSLPHLEFNASLTIDSRETLERLKQNCSAHYSHIMQDKLDSAMEKLILSPVCRWPSDAKSQTCHGEIILNPINQTTSKVRIF